jgi:hypothetical protein
MRTYDERDNLTWFHEDGTSCPAFWSDRPDAGDGRRWWCTEHQQALVTPTRPCSTSSASGGVPAARVTPRRAGARLTESG